MLNPDTTAAANPTAFTYGSLDAVYDFFNTELFDDALPRCLISLQRHKGAAGFFAPERFGSRDGSTITHEIALNPETFADRSTKTILSTLAHEMCHLWLQEHGTPSRGGYHNKQWAEVMLMIGLHPSDTGQPGGKMTGPRMTHYIIEGGRFDKAFAILEARGIGELLADRWSEDEAKQKARKKKNASKTAFVCPSCLLKAWAKADAKLMCGECEEVMQAQGGDAGERED